jgi:inner membrane protein involved in colicin E2 resistance
MVKRIIAIAFIFVCTAVAWAILGGTIFSRTYESRSRSQGRVESTWGAPHVQKPPAASYTESETRTAESVEDGRKVVRTAQVKIVRTLPLESSRVQAGFELDYRRKGLLWHSTYKVAFAGSYAFRNATDVDRDVTFNLEFPAARAIYDNLAFSVDGQPVALASTESGASAVARVGAGKTALLAVAYRSQGLESWRYNFGGAVSQVKDFSLRMTTNFKGIDFPDDTLSPSEKRETAAGWELVWNYKNLVSGFQIGLKMPEKLQPGPVAGKISLFAPVSLFFFFFLMLIITTMRGIELHPMNYFFLAAAFFSFHLLVAYLVDHISIHAAFAISSAVSILLVVSYLRLVVGLRFAAVEAGLAQLIYLVLFSYAFFLEGFTGLAITIGSILTLFVVMQMTGRIRWTDKFAGPSGKV